MAVNEVISNTEATISAMSYEELVAELQYMASVLDDQPHYHDEYILEIVKAMVKKTEEWWAE